MPSSSVSDEEPWGCDTETGLSAIVTVAVRGVCVSFALAVSSTVALPSPLVADAVIQAGASVIDHLQPALAVTSTRSLPPVAEKVATVGDTLNLQVPDWETFTDLPATVIVELREFLSLFADAVTVTARPPDPVSGDAVIQLGRPVTDQRQALAVVTVRFALPPVNPKESAVGDTE
jgi:hypothetical protein